MSAKTWTLVPVSWLRQQATKQPSADPFSSQQHSAATQNQVKVPDFFE
jgi:hypothetical protein